jgi:hypothetical protein
VTSALSRLTLSIIRATAASLAALTLASCGGGVSANPSPLVTSDTLTILPATAVMYSGLPTTFVLSGGTGAYILTSSNQAILQISGGVTGRSVTLVPSFVAADTDVTLTLRDTGSAAPVSATVTVRPGTLNNDLTITPSPTQASSCSPALCSGTDAEVTVTLSQGGIPLAARGVKFEVVSGDFTFIDSPPLIAHDPPGDLTNVVTSTDEKGIARVRLHVNALAPNQTALLQVKDLISGAFRRTSFAIAQYNGNTPSFFTLPSSLTFSGPNTSGCASGAFADVAIFGGTPPYRIVNVSPSVTLSTTTVAASGDKFRVSLAFTATCLTDVPIAVTDATGRTLTVTVSNVAGTTAPPISLAPSTIALSCSSGTTAVTSSFTISGGTAPFAAGTDHPRVSVTVTGRTVSVQRLGGDGTTSYPTTAIITVTDGTTTAAATATAPANCPGGGTTSAPITAAPSSVTVTGTFGNPGVNVFLSGGTGTFSVLFVSDPRITASIAGASLNINTAFACGAPATPLSASVVVSSGTSSLAIPVTATVCP